jgi:capsular exopolysaccharide synthesis family protein
MMHNLVPVAQPGYTDLELASYRRDLPRTTPIERIAAGVYRQRFLAALIFIATVAIGAILTFKAPRLYTAEALVQLEQQAPRVLADPELDPQGNAQDADRFLQTQLDVVRSRSLAEAVANKTKVTLSPAMLAALEVPPGNTVDRREAAIAQLQNNVDAELGLNTRLARISFTSRDPIVSAAVANAFAAALVASNLNAKQKTSRRAKRYLTSQLTEAKERLEASEREMLAYARNADLSGAVAPSDEKNPSESLRVQQLNDMTNTLTQATGRRVEAQQRWVQVSGTPGLSLPEAQENRTIQDLQSQKIELEAALEAERQRHTADYPSAREAAAKIRQLDTRIEGLAARVKESLHGRYIAAAQHEREISAIVAGLRNAAMSERERGVGYDSLQREVETHRAFYKGLLQRYKEVAAASGAPSANVTIVDRAWPPLEPSSPNVPRSLALASMAGLVLALFMGVVRESMHNVIHTAEDLELNLNLATLGVVPAARARLPMSDALDDPRSPQSEAYHSLAVALDQASSGMLPKTLLITSSMASEGKSTSALGLARSLSAMGKRVLLIDGDLRRPTHGDSRAPGLSDVLDGSTKPQTVVQREDEHGFSLLGAGGTSDRPVSLLATQHVDSILDQLSREYDIMIIDGPPVMGLADAVLLARRVEAVLVVVEANRISIGQLDLALSRLPASSVIGAVITKFNAKGAGVSYGGAAYYKY